MSDASLDTCLIEAMKTLPIASLDIVAWRHGRFELDLLEVPVTAPGPARWLDEGDTNAIHLSTSEEGMWAEARKHAPPEVELTEYGRRAGAVRCHLDRMVDLCDPDVRSTLGVDEHDLVRDDDLTVCRALATAARQLGLEGLVSPSAALDTARTIVVFEAGFGGLEVLHEEVRSPPPPP